MQAAPPPIKRDELVYRRIPSKTGWVDAAGIVSPAAFLPNRGDTASGISLSRAWPDEAPEHTAQRVAEAGTLGNDYHVAELIAGELLDANIPVVPNPVDGDPMHAQVQGWTHDKRDDDAVRTGAEKAASIVKRVFGPHPGKKPRVQLPL